MANAREELGPVWCRRLVAAVTPPIDENRPLHAKHRSQYARLKKVNDLTRLSVIEVTIVGSSGMVVDKDFCIALSLGRILLRLILIVAG